MIDGDLQDGRAGQVATVAEVRSSHHVLGVEHLLGQLWDADGTERVGTAAGEGSKANHEEVETGERNHVDSQLSEIRVELAREAEASGDTRHDGRDEVVEISVGWVGELEGPHADIIESLVVNAEGLIRVLDQLVDGEGSVVWLDDGIRDLGRRDNGEGGHHAVWEFLADLGDQKRTHTGTGSTTKGVGNLEALEAVASFGLTADDIENLVDKFSTFGVMTLGPVVSSTRLAEDEVVGAEELAEGAGTDSVHGTGLQIDEDGTRDILVARGLCHISRWNGYCSSIHTSLK
jgi:hypothetical protein